MSPSWLGSATEAISVLERTGWMPSSCSAMSKAIWLFLMGLCWSRELKSLGTETGRQAEGEGKPAMSAQELGQLGANPV